MSKLLNCRFKPSGLSFKEFYKFQFPYDNFEKETDRLLFHASTQGTPVWMTHTENNFPNISFRLLEESEEEGHSMIEILSKYMLSENSFNHEIVSKYMHVSTLILDVDLKPVTNFF